MTEILRILIATAEVLAALLIVPLVMAVTLAGLALVVLRATALPLATVAVAAAGVLFATRAWPIS